MKLYFARHGQSEANAKGSDIDPATFLDGPLTDLGSQQATMLADDLKDIEFDVIISSPLQRAYQTAEIVNKYHNLPIEIDSAWREREAGVFADLNEWAALFDFDKNPAPENTEPLTEFLQRVYDAVDNLKHEHGDKTIFIASHGGVQHGLYAYMNKLPWSGNMRIKPMLNCEYRIYDI